MNNIGEFYFCLEILVGKTMTTTLQETNFSLVSRKSVEETWNDLLGIMTEDVHCTNNFTLLTVLVVDGKDVDEC